MIRGVGGTEEAAIGGDEQFSREWVSKFIGCEVSALFRFEYLSWMPLIL